MSEGGKSAGTDGTASIVRGFIDEHFPAARKQSLGDDDSLLDSGIVDSLGILEIVSFLSETFAIEVSDEDLVPENFQSVATLVDFIERRGGLSR